MFHISRAVLLLGACLAGSQSFAFGKLPPEEVRTLFSGNTVETERRDGGVPGVDSPDRIENFATTFSLYFDTDGTIKKKTDGNPKAGKWRVTDDAKLCMEWKRKKEKCGHLHKQGNTYKRVIRRKNGFILYEHTYVDFVPGNKYGL
jgi:hypothetical protein